jgi:hypothetical protein
MRSQQKLVIPQELSSEGFDGFFGENTSSNGGLDKKIASHQKFGFFEKNQKLGIPVLD